MNSSEPTMPMLRPLLAGLVLLVIAGCGSPENQSDGNGGPGGFRPGGPGGFGGRGGPGGGEPIIPAVEVVQAELGSLPLEERLTGRVSARNQTDIYSEVAGPVTEIFVENGDFVEEGEPLLQLRDVEFRERYQQAAAGLEIARAQTRQAEANLALLRSQLQRTQQLIDRNLETQSALDTILSQVSVAEADLDLRTAQENQSASVLQERSLQLQNTTVRAPVSGQIGRRNAERGMMVNTSSPLFTIGDLSRIQVEVLLTERMLSYIEEGTPVNLYSDTWGDTVLHSEITRISPFLDPSTMRTVAHIELDNSRNLLRSGMFITVDILYGESEQAVLIPNSAFYRHPRTGIEGVYVVRAPSQEVAPLAEQDDNQQTPVITPPLPVSFVPVEVIASGRMASGVTGMEAGDWVVTVGQNLLTGNVTETRVRQIPWERMIEMQQMQSRDLFKVIDQQQQQQKQALGDNS